MCRIERVIACIVLAVLVAGGYALAQSSGSRGGVQDGRIDVSMPLLDREIAQQYITIEGTAEVRVQPTQIRVVLAVTSEADSAQACQQSIQRRIDQLKQAWTTLDIEPNDIVVDFIAVLPRYAWAIKTREGTEVDVERKVGYRMQTNVHLQMDKEQTAQQAIAAAFTQGVTDIIAFDYWSNNLNEVKVKARMKAIEVAKAKADMLLGASFDKRPPVINLQEQTRVVYPRSLYESFVNSHEETLIPRSRRNVPAIRAARPQNTYYRGPYLNGDVMGTELPMRPEIAVASTVRLYFASPVAILRVKPTANGTSDGKAM